MIQVSKQSARISRLSRREFAIFGVEASIVVLGSLAGCESGTGSEIEPIASFEDEQALHQASEDWDIAYAEASGSWSLLQDAISTAEEKNAEFLELTIKNPEALIIFEDELENARIIKNQHDNMKKPKALEDLIADVEDFESIVVEYDAATDRLVFAWDAVEVLNPFKGEFDITDKYGYTYHIEYDIEKPVADVDTTRGKPGEVGVTFKVPNPHMTVTNTTQGKKAPWPYSLESIYLIYPVGQLSSLMQNFPDATDLYGWDITAISQAQTYLQPVHGWSEHASGSGWITWSVDELESALATNGAGPRYDFGWYFLLMSIDGQFSHNEGLGVGESRKISRVGGDVLWDFIIPDNKVDVFTEGIANVAGIAISSTLLDCIGYEEDEQFCHISAIG